MRSTRLWAVLGITKAVVEGVDYDDDADAVVVSVRPRKATKRRCGQCGRRCPGYDRGEGRRRWRALDLGVVLAYLEADAPRVNCPTHGPTVAQVPGPATAPGTPMRSMTWWRGWPPTLPSRR